MQSPSCYRRALPRTLSAVLCLLLAMPADTVKGQQPAPLDIQIIEGEGAINNVRQRTVRETIVQVNDENRKPVAGAAVVFTLPGQGSPGVAATGGLQTVSTTTDAAGRAVLRGVQPNNLTGQYQIKVEATSQGRRGETTINQTNILAAASRAPFWRWVAVGAGAAVVATVVAVTVGGNGDGPIVIAPGAPTVGGPR